MSNTTLRPTDRTAPERRFDVRVELGAASLYILVTSLLLLLYITQVYENLPVPHYYIDALETDLEGVIDFIIVALVPTLTHIATSYYRGSYTVSRWSLALPLIFLAMFFGTAVLGLLAFLLFPVTTYVVSAAIYYLPARV